MTAPRLRIALPWLQSALAAAGAHDALPPLESLRWLGGRGRLQATTHGSWRDWLLEPALGAAALATVPAGPAVAARQGAAVDGQGSWCLAQPVHLVAGLDHVRMSSLATASPTAAEANELAAAVTAHFEAGGPRVVAFVDGAFLLRFDSQIECVTQPPDAVTGRDVHDAMPSGRDGARVRSLMNEIQMLLHDHPVNLRRERARQTAINGWWLWGFGAAANRLAPCDAGWTLRTDDAWLQAAWPEAEPLSERASDRDTLVGCVQPPAHDEAAALAQIEAGLLRQAATAIRAGAISRVELLAGDRVLQVGPAARWRFWRRPLPLERWLE